MSEQSRFDDPPTSITHSVSTLWTPTIPYGVFDLDPMVSIRKATPPSVKCFVRGCGHYLVPPNRWNRGEECPDHRIRCHLSGTYSYPDVRRNTIVDPNLLMRVVRSPDKFESHRLGSENSEDAATYAAFRSIQAVGHLNYVARYITGADITDEPSLYLWGLSISDGSLVPFDLLIAARKRFEVNRLPVRRPATEPDAMLYLPGHYLILIEVKLGSPNTVVLSGTRKDPQSLTKEELVNLYRDRCLSILDTEKAMAAEEVYGQLWRNVVFSEWMSRQAPPGTKAYFANLTRAYHENESFEHFAQIVRPEFAERVSHIRWEDLFVIAGLAGGRLRLLQQYLLGKTLSLQPAFRFGFW